MRRMPFRRSQFGSAFSTITREPGFAGLLGRAVDSELELSITPSSGCTSRFPAADLAAFFRHHIFLLRTVFFSQRHDTYEQQRPSAAEGPGLLWNRTKTER